MHKQKIIDRVIRAVESHFDLYSFTSMIDDCDDLTDEEQQWAKEWLDWKVVDTQNGNYTRFKERYFGGNSNEC